MNISSQTNAHLSPLQVLRYKQRLMAMVEVFDADLCLCLVRQAQDWCVVGLEGQLVRERWQDLVPHKTIEKTLSDGKGLLLLELLGETDRHCLMQPPVVSAMSALLQDETVIFVAAKRLKKGVYRDADLASLGQFMEAFENAHKTS